jgi:excisionase family DNA binding protein
LSKRRELATPIVTYFGDNQSSFISKRKLETPSGIEYIHKSSPNEKLFFENQISQEWLSTKEAASYLRITENALHICVHRNQIKVYRFGRRLRFRLGELRGVLLKGAR